MCSYNSHCSVTSVFGMEVVVLSSEPPMHLPELFFFKGTCHFLSCEITITYADAILWPPSRQRLIPQVDLHSVWQDVCDLAGAFQSPLPLVSATSRHLGCPPIGLSSGSLSEKVILSVLSLLASTSHSQSVEGLNAIPLLQ